MPSPADYFSKLESRIQQLESRIASIEANGPPAKIPEGPWIKLNGGTRSFDLKTAIHIIPRHKCPHLCRFFGRMLAESVKIDRLWHEVRQYFFVIHKLDPDDLHLWMIGFDIQHNGIAIMFGHKLLEPIPHHQQSPLWPEKPTRELLLVMEDYGISKGRES